MTAEEYIIKIKYLNPEQALAACEEALAKFPHAAQLYVQKASLIWLQSGSVESPLFLELLKKASDLDPTYAQSVLKKHTYPIGGKELIWRDWAVYTYRGKELMSTNFNGPQIPNNLYIKDFWNMKDTLGHNDDCVDVKIESEDTFCFWTFTGFKVKIQIKENKIKCLEREFTK